jgi:hypothetical protein
MSTQESIPIHTDTYYEELASQEELYLEKTEEAAVAILTSYVSPESQKNRCAMTAESPDAQLVVASEELITGDADDPPLSEEAVQELLNDLPARSSDLRIAGGGES